MFQDNIKIIIFLSFLNLLSFGQKDSLGLQKCIKNPDNFNGQQVYKTVDKMPEYKGGVKELAKYIIDKVHLGCVDNNFNSVIYTTFVIDTAGHIKNVCTITKNAEPNYHEKQVKEIIENAPSWTPGQLNGKNVCVRMTIPLRICLK